MKILVLGAGRHGKDTAAHFIAGLTGLEFTSSSLFACEKAVYPHMEYNSVRECYRDRHNHRQLWYNLIKDYNKTDRSRLCMELLIEYDIYVGMRDDEEYEASKHLFDHIFWVDASGRKPKDETMKIEYDEHKMTLIDNNSSVIELFEEVVCELNLIFNL